MKLSTGQRKFECCSRSYLIGSEGKPESKSEQTISCHVIFHLSYFSSHLSYFSCHLNYFIT